MTTYFVPIEIFPAKRVPSLAYIPAVSFASSVSSAYSTRIETVAIDVNVDSWVSVLTRCVMHTKRTTAKSTSSLCHTIANIISVCSNEKMFGIATAWIVAMMANKKFTAQRKSKPKMGRQSVRLYFTPVIGRFSIPLRFGSLPFPTARSFLDCEIALEGLLGIEKHSHALSISHGSVLREVR